MRAMLEEEAPGDVVVLYGVRSEADAVLLNEVPHGRATGRTAAPAHR